MKKLIIAAAALAMSTTVAHANGNYYNQGVYVGGPNGEACQLNMTFGRDAYWAWITAMADFGYSDGIEQHQDYHGTRATYPNLSSAALCWLDRVHEPDAGTFDGPLEGKYGDEVKAPATMSGDALTDNYMKIMEREHTPFPDQLVFDILEQADEVKYGQFKQRWAERNFVEGKQGPMTNFTAGLEDLDADDALIMADRRGTWGVASYQGVDVNHYAIAASGASDDDLVMMIGLNSVDDYVIRVYTKGETYWEIDEDESVEADDFMDPINAVIAE